MYNTLDYVPLHTEYTIKIELRFVTFTHQKQLLHSMKTTAHLPTLPYPSTAGIIHRRLLLGFAFILLAISICGVGMYASVSLLSNKVPGDSLYGLKIATEKVFGSIQLTNTGRVEHNISLLEARVNELNRYALNVSSSSPDQLQQIANKSDEHAREALNTLAGDPSIAATTRINLLADIDATVRAEAAIVDMNTQFDPISGAIDANEERITTALRTAITDFVSQNATDTIEQFIGEKVATLSADIKTVAPGSRAQNLVMRRVQDTEEAITDKKYTEAIAAIIRAEQAIAIDGYLYDAERGPVDGVTIDAGPIPEGN